MDLSSLIGSKDFPFRKYSNFRDLRSNPIPPPDLTGPVDPKNYTGYPLFPNPFSMTFPDFPDDIHFKCMYTCVLVRGAAMSEKIFLVHDPIFSLR